MYTHATSTNDGFCLIYQPSRFMSLLSHVVHVIMVIIIHNNLLTGTNTPSLRLMHFIYSMDSDILLIIIMWVTMHNVTIMLVNEYE